ncbi:hypothetical protein E1180_20605 [Roseibium denhamense]|uniref:hypothetical protein n=1 Tax=Roseibium denhamense TaxID=76305 RepID=UPI0012BB9B33|nr:hypothetical protein [Roseibium denhamense]MTI07906.1 hypothetical protein [Roseibium denhamense]
MRETVQETFTPMRVGVLSWAFAAVLMATIGLASFKFASGHARIPSTEVASITLPPPGDIETTASTPVAGRLPIEVMRVPGGAGQTADPVSLAHIEVLQKEIIGLRRRLSALSEQNIAYSRRIAALEKKTSVIEAPTSAADAVGSADDISAANPSERALLAANNGARPMVPVAKPGPVELLVSESGLDQVAPAPASGARQEPLAEINSADGRRVPRTINLNRTLETQPAPSVDLPTYFTDPVRVVELPQTSEPPETTASINPEARFEPAPVNAPSGGLAPDELIVSPSGASGRFRSSGGESLLKRSDFGALVGYYSSTAAAAQAWATIKDQNEERMRDLRPLLFESSEKPGTVSLLIGPFGNAADASVACFRLLEVTDLCHPAIYSGDPLIAAAQFPETNL